MTFEPLRRWKFGTSYRYGVTTSVAAASGAVLQRTFSGEFSTFAPRVVGSLALDDVRDVAVSGNLGIVATNSGATVLDLTRPDAPTSSASIPLAGGAGGVAIVTTALTDRNGLSTGSPLAVVASGDVSSAGVVQTFFVEASGALSLVGMSQVSTPAGQTAPPGVPGLAGVPSAVVVDASGRALVSVRDVGLSSVLLGAAIPHDPANPGAALGPRFPTSGPGDAVQSALVGEHLVVAGASGLTVLNAASLTVTGELTTSQPLRAIVGLPDFGFDIDGDDAIDPVTEVIDLAIAGDDNGVLQLVRISGTTPELISVIRMPGLSAIGGVTVSAVEGLAYVGAGGRGLVMVDLTGPASIQPIDQDRNGLDDRVLGVVDTPGSAGRMSPDLGRGLGFLADGSAGVAVLQLLAPRIRLLTLKRDPLRGRPGDERSILASREAFTTDEAVVAELDVLLPPGEQATVVVEEAPVGDDRSLRIDGTSQTRQLTSGRQEVVITIEGSEDGTKGTLIALVGAGRPALVETFELIGPDIQGELEQLVVVPDPVSVTVPEQRALSVGGRYTGGLLLNLTASESGTTYETTDSRIATVTPAGVLEAIAGGFAEVIVANGAQRLQVPVTVQGPPALTALEPEVAPLTLVQSAPTDGRIMALFTDGSEIPAAQVAGTSFQSSNESVVSVDAAGVLTAHGNGGVTITARNGALSATLDVYVELRTAPSLTQIQLLPETAVASLDDGPLEVTAVVTGSGSLDSAVVTITAPANPSVSGSGITGFDGRVRIALSGVTQGGPLGLLASVIDPASGQTLTDSETYTIAAGSNDTEPNDSEASASALSPQLAVQGALAAGTDQQDVYRVDSGVSGTLEIRLDLGADTPITAIRLVVRSADGTELLRVTPTLATEHLSVAIPSAGAFVAVELVGTAASYQISSDVTPGPLSVASVQPSLGSPGATVRVTGAGFSSRPDTNLVLFAGVQGRVVQATPTLLDVIVPAHAVDGPIVVVSAGRQATGPSFQTGNPGPLPPAQIAASTAANLRRDPLTQQLVDIKRLRAIVDPSSTPAEVAQMASALGGTVVGVLPRISGYYLEFPQNNTFAGLAQIEQALRANPRVTLVTTISRVPVQTTRIDTRDRGSRWPTTSGTPGSQFRSAAYEQILLFEAVSAVRRHPAFADDANLKTVRVAVIDSGFNPKLKGEFSPGAVCTGSTSIVRSLKGVAGKVLVERDCSDVDGHGTEVTGIIGALNDKSDFSGIFGSLFEQDDATALEKLEIYAYGCDDDDTGIDWTCQDLAFDDIQGKNLDVVNLSYGENFGRLAEFNDDQGWYRQQMRPVSGRTLFVASAGNEGLDASRSSPSALTKEPEGHVVSVGAVATQNLDKTGEVWDARAIYSQTTRPRPNGLVNCDDAKPVDGSNCGLIDLAAPGDEVFTTSKDKPYDEFGGTSAAAPMVAGVAAVLQAIRPNTTPLTPREIKRVLKESGDELQSVWTPGPARRLNALAAVRRLLPPRPAPRVWVAHTPSNGTTSRTVIAGLTMDPVDGDVTIANAAEVVLKASVNGTEIVANRIAVMKTSPVDGRIYVLAETDSSLGDGVFVVNPASQRVDCFVLLGGDSGPAVRIPDRTGMAFSHDYRLLFAPNAAGVVAINTVSCTLTSLLSDLPGSLAAQAPALPELTLEANTAQIEHRVVDAAPTATFRTIRDLSVSPDGRTLFALVTRGTGPGNQPGVIVPIDISMASDLLPATFPLEPQLAGFLTPGQGLLRMTTASDDFASATNDEPAAIAVTADGKHLQVVNGGIDAFVATVDPTVPQVGTLAFASVQGTSQTTQTTQFEVVQDNIRNDLSDGVTILLAPGYAGAFTLPPTGAIPQSQTWHFPSEVVFGWNPATDRFVNQFRNSEVYAKRPFNIALRPDGRRALVPFYQTGNFGVLDLDWQKKLTSPALSDLATFFNAYIAVTPAIEFDSHLTPSRGRTATAPSPDVNRWFPGPIVYSQNGRYAAAVHTGAGSPKDYGTAGAPDFRGGGSLSLIDDRAITQDLEANSSLEVEGSSGPKFFFSDRPLCRQHNADATCQDELVTQFTEYRTFGIGAVHFDRPSAVAIDPVLLIEAPASGTHARLSTSINLSWSYADVRRVIFRVQHLGTLDAPEAPTQVALSEPALEPVHMARRTYSISFGRLTLSAPHPEDRHVYRVSVELLDSNNEQVAASSVDVVFFK